MYTLVNHQEAAKDTWDKVKMLMKGTELSYPERECILYNLFDKFAHVSGETFLVVPMFQQGEDLIECNNKAMGYAGTGNRGIATTSMGNYVADQLRIITEAGQILDEEQLAFLADPDCDDLSSAKAIMMANLSSCDPEVLYEVLYSDSYPNDMINQDVQEMQYSEQTHIDDFQESQDAVVQDTNSFAPNDLLVLSLVEQMTDHLGDTKNDVIAKEHAVISVIDDEETLILEEESRSKMLDKQNDPISIEKKIKISPIDYSKLNKIKEDFGKRFVTKKELSAEQAFWLKHSSFSETPVTSHTPVRIEAPSELPKVSLVNESLKKLKYQLANFDNVVKKRTTSDAITAGAWGFEHTKACFVTEIIPFLKVLKDTFNAFDKTLLDEITEVQTVFNQMEAAVDQCSVDKNAFEIQIKQLSIDNDQLLKQIMSQEIVHIAVNSVDSFDVKKSCVNDCNKCLELETELLKKKDLIEKDVYDKLLKSYSTLEKHCISLELTTQLNQEVFQKDNFRENQNAPTFNQLFELNELKAQSQEKDMVIRKLKDRIKSLSGKDSVENSVENLDLNAQLQEKVFAITALENEVKKLKGKNVVDTAVSKPNATIAPGMFKLDIKPISHRLKNNRDAHEVYIEKTIENTNTLRGFVERTCPNSPKPSEKLVAVTPINKDKRVRFAEPVTSSSNIPKPTDSLKTKDSNKHLLTSTRVKHTTSVSGSKPLGNTKNNRISQPPSSNQKNKVEDHFRKVKSSLNKMNSIYEPVSNALVKHSMRNAKFESICAICNKCLFDANHDMCIIDYLNDVNEPKQSWESIVSDVPSSSLNDCRLSKLFSVRFENDHIAKIMGYGDYQMENFTLYQNDVVKRQNHTLVVAARTVLIFSKAPLFLWVEAVATAYYTQNQSFIRKHHNKTPYELLHDQKPELSYLHVFGALCYPTNDGEDLGKLKPKVDIGIFVVPTVIAPEPAVLTDTPPTSTSQTPPATPSPVIPLGVEEANHDIKVVIPNHVHSINQPPKHINKWTKDHLIDNVIGDPSRPVSTRQQLQDEALFCYFDALLSSVEPKSYKDSLMESCWIEAMQEELNEFERLEVWELVPRPDCVMVITLKWIFKVKLDELGGVLKNKARLVARGYRQEEGIDFEESFALVARL
ncbi:integrase, catalytic region, zinc finger, CCHC-type containing protein [Tanacetum coccineum]